MSIEAERGIGLRHGRGRRAFPADTKRTTREAAAFLGEKALWQEAGLARALDRKLALLCGGVADADPGAAARPSAHEKARH